VKHNTAAIHAAKQLVQLKGLKLIPHLMCSLWIVLKNSDAHIAVKII
jgi:hypothetical protein